MPSIRISINAKWERRLRSMAKEYDISMSDIMNEVSEWVLNQETNFRTVLDKSLKKTKNIATILEKNVVAEEVDYTKKVDGIYPKKLDSKYNIE